MLWEGVVKGHVYEEILGSHDSDMNFGSTCAKRERYKIDFKQKISCFLETRPRHKDWR